MHNLKKHRSQFVEWIPDNMLNTICKVPATNSNVSGTFLANSSVQVSTMNGLADAFSLMWKKNAYVHWYTSEGMDQQEFAEALNNV